MELFSQFASVCLVLALAISAAYWLRRGVSVHALRAWGRTTSGARIRLRLIQRVPLTPQHCLCVVSVDTKEWILAVHPGGVTILEQSPGQGCKTGISVRQESPI